MDSYKKYSAEFKIRSYEVDGDQKANISSIANYFQEAAGLHACKLNFDITDLYKDGLTWILFKMDIKVYEYPERWEKVNVLTWPSTGDPVRAFRDYELVDDTNNVLAKGLSQWMMIDINRKRPVRIPQKLATFDVLPDNHELDSGKEAINGSSDQNKRFITTVSRYNLDMNNHVNNVCYIEWLTGFSNYLDGKSVKKIKIQYFRESLLNDNIYLSESADRDNLLNGTLFNQNNEEIARAEIKYT